jgi:hypothetical protein
LDVNGLWCGCTIGLLLVGWVATASTVAVVPLILTRRRCLLRIRVGLLRLCRLLWRVRRFRRDLRVVGVSSKITMTAELKERRKVKKMEYIPDQAGTSEEDTMGLLWWTTA